MFCIVNIDSLPIVADWIPYISFIRWAFEAFCINQFQDETYSCDSNNTGCVPDGETVLRNLSFDNESLSQATLGLGVMLLIFLFSALTFLEVFRMKFMPLGHVGYQYQQLMQSSNSSDGNGNGIISNGNSSSKSSSQSNKQQQVVDNKAIGYNDSVVDRDYQRVIIQEEQLILPQPEQGQGQGGDKQKQHKHNKHKKQQEVEL